MSAPDTARPRSRIPRDKTNDYSDSIAAERRAFVESQTGAKLEHVAKYSFNPATLPGNIESFIGVAQVPLGVAGPLRIVGEHARGDFYVPLATTEGSLLASYNRGMRMLSDCGGVKTTVVAHAMQRAPCFMFENAQKARDLGRFIDAHFDEIKVAAEDTTNVGKLVNITQHAVGPLLYLRFNYTVGDAAGQNMTGKATFAGCEWIKAQHPDHPEYVLTGNIDTDKKHSQINMLLTRGRRVVAEIVLKKEIAEQQLGVSPQHLFFHRQISATGAFMGGSAYDGAHAANALAGLFIATGQDVANVAESHAGMAYTQLLPNGDYYWSITLPALIVGTYGGGTGLATQRECLEMLGCYGEGKGDKLAEICAAVVLAGDISLSAAILAGTWVAAHEQFGRNRP